MTKQADQPKSAEKNHKKTRRDVYIVDGSRTPFLKAKGRPGPFAAADLAVSAGQALLARQPFEPTDLEKVVVGCMMPSEKECNIGRLIGLRLGCGISTPGYTVQRNCASGMQAIDSAYKDITLGRCDLVLAGGTETMSRAPLMLNAHMVNWLADWAKAKSIGQKLTTLGKLRPNMLAPIIALIYGLTDPIEGINMAQTAEVLAKKFGITRQDMDAYAVRSHERLAKAYDEKLMGDEVSPLYTTKGKVFEEDEGMRRDSTLQKLSTLRSVTNKKFGLVTAGNSSQITDGAALLILASEDAVKKYGLKPLGKIEDIEWAALEPAEMGLGPVFASTPVLKRHGLGLNDIDCWELNEAFAAQVIACQRAWESDDFCKEYLGLEKAMGKLDDARLNMDGGAIAAGHPVGASGARIVLHTLNVLKRNQAKRGMATICIGGGQGGAMLIESHQA